MQVTSESFSKFSNWKGAIYIFTGNFKSAKILHYMQYLFLLYSWFPKSQYLACKEDNLVKKYWAMCQKFQIHMQYFFFQFPSTWSETYYLFSIYISIDKTSKKFKAFNFKKQSTWRNCKWKCRNRSKVVYFDWFEMCYCPSSKSFTFTSQSLYNSCNLLYVCFCNWI